MKPPKKPKVDDEAIIDDPLQIGLIGFGDSDALPKRQVAIPTGLSEAEDAQRFLAKTFGGEQLICPNCETVYAVGDDEGGRVCYRCRYMTTPVDQSLMIHVKRKLPGA